MALFDGSLSVLNESEKPLRYRFNLIMTCSFSSGALSRIYTPCQLQIASSLPVCLVAVPPPSPYCRGGGRETREEEQLRLMQVTMM